MSALQSVGACARPKNRRHGKVTTVVAAIAGAAAVMGAASSCAPQAATGDVVTIAAHQQGKPYVYGAAGPNAFDCSGLVQYVFRLAGRSEPRVAQAQYNASIHLPASQARRGDLVFWGAPYGVYHVGIYLGNGQMIDAAHTGTNVRQERVWPGASYGRLVR